MQAANRGLSATSIVCGEEWLLFPSPSSLLAFIFKIHKRDINSWHACEIVIKLIWIAPWPISFPIYISRPLCCWLVGFSVRQKKTTVFYVFTSEESSFVNTLTSTLKKASCYAGKVASKQQDLKLQQRDVASIKLTCSLTCVPAVCNFHFSDKGFFFPHERQHNPRRKISSVVVALPHKNKK